jgi:hypothetical protein
MYKQPANTPQSAPGKMPGAFLVQLEKTSKEKGTGHFFSVFVHLERL